MAPGEYHHARWLSKAHYSIKIWLFKLQAQIQLTAHEERGMREVALFIVTVYLEAWFSSPIPTESPRQNLALIKSRIHHAGVNPAISKATLEKFHHQLWYLSEDLVGLAFFGTGVMLSERMVMVATQEKEGHEDHVRDHCSIYKTSSRGCPRPSSP